MLDNLLVKEIKIREAKLSDLSELEMLEKQCFSDPWSRKSLRSEIEYVNDILFLVAVLDKEIIGYIDVQMVLDEADVRRVAVKPAYRNQHIASILMEIMLNYTDSAGIKTHTLDVRAGNTAALKLYGKFGFYENGRRKNYYEGNEDAILMMRIGEVNLENSLQS